MTEETLIRKISGIPPSPAFSTPWENVMVKLSRRSALTVIAAAGAVPAGAAAAACVDDPDAELRRLWNEYQRLAQLSDAARDAHQPFRDVENAKLEEIRKRGLPWAEEQAAAAKVRDEGIECRRTLGGLERRVPPSFPHNQGDPQ
jgi:hypothetical protein